MKNEDYRLDILEKGRNFKKV